MEGGAQGRQGSRKGRAQERGQGTREGGAQGRAGHNEGGGAQGRGWGSRKGRTQNHNIVAACTCIKDNQFPFWEYLY